MLHVYSEDEGDLTLVFMAGHGTNYPTLDFKPLWMRIVDEYWIAVIEKSGYGWSETSNSPRDKDTMLEETRMALQLAGENAPYVLIPHSMSGLETETVSKNGVPINTPMYFFISDAQELIAKGWNESLMDYLSTITNG